MTRMPRHMRCPKGWTRKPSYHIPDGGPEVRRFLSPDGLLVSTSYDEEDNPPRAWVHAACSRPDRMPDYEDLQTMRRLFIGTDRVALQIFPVEEEYVNVHPNCLHLWSPDGFNPLLPERA